MSQSNINMVLFYLRIFDIVWHKWVEPLALGSLAAGAEGLMIECHPDPRNAAVDPLQGIDFQSFYELMDDMQRVAISVDRNILI
mgnify:CR=1 FL=1